MSPERPYDNSNFLKQTLDKVVPYRRRLRKEERIQRYALKKDLDFFYGAFKVESGDIAIRDIRHIIELERRAFELGVSKLPSVTRKYFENFDTETEEGLDSGDRALSGIFTYWDSVYRSDETTRAFDADKIRQRILDAKEIIKVRKKFLAITTD